MTKYVVPVPNPSPGQDWQTVVPGIYLWDVVGITAQLTTGSLGGTFWAVSYDEPTGTASFYLDGALVGTDTQPSAPLALAPTDTALAESVSGTATWDELAMFNGALPAGSIAGLFAAAQVSYAAYVAAVLALVPAAYYHLDPYPSGGGVCADASGNGNDLTYTDNTGTGPLVPAAGLVAGGQAITADNAEIATGPIGGLGTGSFTQIGWLDPATLAQGLILAFLVANPGGHTMWVIQATNTPTDPLMQLLRVVQIGPTIIQTFSAPNGSFTGGAGTGRTPSLVVSNGTDDVLVIPDGFQAVSTPGPYGYAWQPGLNADTQSTDGTLTTVAIPALVIPAGYTVGTQTFDLSPDDQWSEIAVWWDDSLQQLAANLSPYDYGGGAHLIYHQLGT